MTTTPTGTTTIGEPSARHGLTVRARITASIAVLLLIALSCAGLIVYAIAYSDTNATVQNEVEQEFDELDAFLRRYPPPAAGQAPDSLEERLRNFLRNNVPDDQEILVGWVNDGPELRIAGDDVEDAAQPMSVDPDFLAATRRLVAGDRSVASIDLPSYGEVVIAAQRVRQGDTEGAGDRDVHGSAARGPGHDDAHLRRRRALLPACDHRTRRLAVGPAARPHPDAARYGRGDLRVRHVPAPP
jgi:hypothetical protein